MPEVQPFLPKTFFFAGSSSVGKTTTLESLDDGKYKKVILSARVPRAELGNPKWEDLISDQALAETQQKAVLKYFMQQIEAHLAEFALAFNTGTLDKHLVFDRSLWDVIGYTVAFKCSTQLITQMVDLVRLFENSLIDKGLIMRLVHFRISDKHPYVEIPARPPEDIRIGCAEVLKVYLGAPLTGLVQIERDYDHVSLEDFVAKLN